MKSLQDIAADQGRPTGWTPVSPRDRLGVELKSMFSGLTEAPMPDRMLQLADALEEAFRRGDLYEIHAGRRVS